MGQISSLFQENPNIINGEEQNAIEEIDVKDITLFENIGWGISGFFHFIFIFIFSGIYVFRKVLYDAGSGGKKMSQ